MEDDKVVLHDDKMMGEGWLSAGKPKIARAGLEKGHLGGGDGSKNGGML